MFANKSFYVVTNNVTHNNQDDVFNMPTPYNINRKFIINELKNKNNPNLEAVNNLLENNKFWGLEDRWGSNILEIACQNPNITLKTFKLLVNNGNPITTYKRTCGGEFQKNLVFANKLLKHLCCNDNVNLDILKYLVEEQSADPDGMVWRKRNALHWACANKNISLEVIQYLLGKGANLNQQDKSGCTPLHVFLDNFLIDDDEPSVLNQAIVRELVLHAEANFELKENAYQQSILHYACSVPQLNPEIILAIFNKSARLDEADREGSTPLDLAYMFNNLNTVIFLLLSGREIGLQNFEDTQPLPNKEQMLRFIAAARTSREALEEELDKTGFLQKLSPACLIELAAFGFLSKNQLPVLKEQGLFSQHTVKYFAEPIKKHLFTYLCWMKNINNNIRNPRREGQDNNLQLHSKIPRPLIHEIMKHVFFNAVASANDKKSKSDNNNHVVFKR